MIDCLDVQLTRMKLPYLVNDSKYRHISSDGEKKYYCVHN